LTHHRGDPFYTPSQNREQDLDRRRAAQARRPLIAQWAPNLPTGYIHIDDAIEYMKRRWGKMVRAEMLEAFSRDDTGPKWTVFGDWPDKSRGERYYAFDDIDMWVYRTMTGIPASWRDIRKLPEGQQSTMPRVRIGNMRPSLREEYEDMLGLPSLGEADHGEE
jgi:hypothetical protein